MDGKQAKRRNALWESLQVMRQRNWQLEGDLMASRTVLRETRQEVAGLQRQLDQAASRSQALEAQVAELQEQLAQLRQVVQGQALPQASAASQPMPPAWVKANVKKKRPKTPGRKAGHEPAHRPLPEHIDAHIDVPLPRDVQGQASCPKCRAQLSEVTGHKRIVEDLIPAQRVVTCYHTFSGYCPGCRKVIESRAPEQPPAPAGVDLPQGQLGLGVLASAALLRVQYRLPFRQITQLLKDLPGLWLSSGAVARQVQRMGRWLAGEYQRLKVIIRASQMVHMDETGWRINGRNGWLWTMLSEHHTVYHVHPSRGRKVAEDLLGDHFAGTLVSDFYAGYAHACGNQQKCLAHLLRNLSETAAADRAFAAGGFFRRCRRLIRELLLLKRKKTETPVAVYEAKGRRLEARLDKLAHDPWQEPHARRLAARLRRHTGELTRFLWHDQVPPTNNAAERALRPAVVARKISGGSRSGRGANATAILLSVLRTATLQHRPLLETLTTLLQASWAGANPGLLIDAFTPNT